MKSLIKRFVFASFFIIMGCFIINMDYSAAGSTVSERAMGLTDAVLEDVSESPQPTEQGTIPEATVNPVKPSASPMPTMMPIANPKVSIEDYYSGSQLIIDNFYYSKTYRITVTNINNPTEIINYSPTYSSVYLSTIGLNMYGDYSIIVHIIDNNGNILASSDSITYSKHVTLNEINEGTRAPMLSAEGIDDGTGYAVYRSIGNTTDFVKVGDFIYDEEEPYVDINAVPGVTYYYRVQAYTKDDAGVVHYDTFSNIVSGTATTDDNISHFVTNKGYLKLVWDDGGGYGYKETYSIYRAEKGDSSYVKVKTLKDTTKCEWTDKNVILGKTYYYIVVCETDFAEIVSIAEIMCTYKPAEITHKTSTPTNMKISWKKVPKANGYKVYLRKPGKTKFKFYKNFKKSKRSFNMKVINGKQYGVKIVAYGTINGTELTGYESIYEPYGDYYGYYNESYDSKWNRVYKGFKNSSSWSVIDKRMTTISVKVWDFASGMSGKKVTKTKYLTCHKRLAPTLKKIFSEIYKGKEKAPIYELGCYSRRSGEHGNGMAVDINSNYNAMFDNGKPTAGSYWNPKKYAYSIKRYGDIEKAFEKYGFSRGFWGSRKDYMHFSYFGT